MLEKNYYIGLDMGTSSVGWAVTDEEYNLVRAKGKDLWGVRLFPEASTAEKRRSMRTSRRRRQREKARIGYLRELFAEEINKIDSGFYQRLDDSKFFEEDKIDKQPFALFSDTILSSISFNSFCLSNTSTLLFNALISSFKPLVSLKAFLNPIITSSV